MPFFKHTLIGIDNICDADCKFVFSKQPVLVYDPQQRPLITGWLEYNYSNLCHIALLSSSSNISTPPVVTTRSYLQAFISHDLPSVEALVWYFHAVAGLLLRDTFLRSIKFGNYSSCLGLTCANDDKYCPYSDETI